MNLEKNYQFIETQDGSYTLYDSEFQEHHHSLIGAYTEASCKFINVSKKLINYKFQKNQELKVLDLPFGLGYNFIALLKYIKTQVVCNGKFNNKITCYALEKDKAVLEKIQEYPENHELKEYFNFLNPLSQTSQNILDLRLEEHNANLKVFNNDLLDILPSLSDSFDLIFYDPFSPRSAPHLWCKDSVLKYFYNLLSDDGLFITYSASNKVRKGLEELGFIVRPSVSVGRKMPGTVAFKSQFGFKDNFDNFTEETKSKIEKAVSYN